ncbi:DUF2531 family protein [Salmonella enterica subsp. enterica serovar Cerro]|nr:DUF2531 family protein [Salmonella enterica subsp. enterica serovar Cerro]
MAYGHFYRPKGPTYPRAVNRGPEALTLTTGKNCAPPQWRWLRQGADNEAMDSHNTDSLDARRAGGKSGESDAGG